MAPCISSLRPTAQEYIPQQQRGAPYPPPAPVPGLTVYVCMAPPPQPEFLPWPTLAPPPPPPFWSVPQAPCVVPGIHGAAFDGGVVAMAPPSGPAPAPVSWPLRRHPEATTGKQRAPAPGPAPAATTAASCGVKAAAGDAKEAAATNQPSPRSVLTVAVHSPPISPTSSLPSSFPYQVLVPAPAPATAGLASAEARPHAKRRAAVRPPQRRGGRPRGPRRARPVQVRRAVKPRRMFDFTSERTSLMIRNIPNDFTRMRLMNILDEHCSIENEKIAPGGVRSEYDFLYLPIDFRSLANKGYAFVNMTSPEAARRLWMHLHGYRWVYKGTAKTCAVDYADRQGNELVKHFAGSCFDCHTEEFLPVRFEPPRDGARPAKVAMHVVGRLGRPRAGHGK